MNPIQAWLPCNYPECFGPDKDETMLSHLSQGNLIYKQGHEKISNKEGAIQANNERNWLGTLPFCVADAQCDQSGNQEKHKLHS